MSSLKERAKMLPNIKLKALGDNFIIEIDKSKYHVSWIQLKAHVGGRTTGTLSLEKLN